MPFSLMLVIAFAGSERGPRGPPRPQTEAENVTRGIVHALNRLAIRSEAIELPAR